MWKVPKTRAEVIANIQNFALHSHRKGTSQCAGPVAHDHQFTRIVKQEKSDILRITGPCWQGDGYQKHGGRLLQGRHTTACKGPHHLLAISEELDLGHMP